MTGSRDSRGQPRSLHTRRCWINARRGWAGFVVDVVQTGTLHITLWRNSAGLVTRERDGFSSFRQTFSNQDTGDSFSSVRSITTQTDYGSDSGGVSTVDVGEDQEPLFLAGRHPDEDVCAALS